MCWFLGSKGALRGYERFDVRPCGLFCGAGAHDVRAQPWLPHVAALGLLEWGRRARSHTPGCWWGLGCMISAMRGLMCTASGYSCFI